MQSLLLEIKVDATFATEDYRNPKDLSVISYSLGWLFMHIHTTVSENVFIYFRALGMILYYRAFTVVLLNLWLPGCTVLAFVYRCKK
jgi:hypothetical protein